MVGPNKVDNRLLTDTVEECRRFGRVLEGEVRKATGVAPDLAVQVFIKFSTMEEALKGALCHFIWCLSSSLNSTLILSPTYGVRFTGAYHS